MTTIPRLQAVSSDPLAALRLWEPVTATATFRSDATAAPFLDESTVRDCKGVGQVVYRSDNGKALAVVGPQFTPVSNRDKVALFDALGERGTLRNLRSGEFGGGRRVWIQGEPDARAQILGQTIQAKLTLCDGHDGSLTLALVDSDVNIICQNTFARAHKTGKGIRLRHTGSIVERFADAVLAIKQSIDGFQESVQRISVMATQQQSKGEWVALLDQFFPLVKAEAGMKGHENDAVQATRDYLWRAYETAPGAVPGTRYGAYQAITHWISHERGHDRTRFEQSLVGEGARLNRAVLAHLLN